MRRCAWLLLVLAGVLVTDCDWEELSFLIVTAQVGRTLDPESNTASILLGRATVENLLHDEWMETPDPGDTSFWSEAFPARVTPVSGASARLNGEAIGQKVSGVYFKAGLGLEHRARYDLEITTPDGETVTAHGFLPDSFAVVSPQAGDSFGLGPVGIVWTHSDSCETFLVGVTAADSGSAAQGWADSFQDTSATVPAAAFQDTLGNPVPGEYVLTVTAVNGGWNKSGLDLFLSGGNVSGASGVFGCAVMPKPVRFRVE